MRKERPREVPRGVRHSNETVRGTGREEARSFASSSLMVMIAFGKVFGKLAKRKHRDLYSGRDMGLLA